MAVTRDVKYDVLVLTPFRRPLFRGAISSDYPGEEPFDSPPWIAAGAAESSGLHVAVLALQNIFPAFNETADLGIVSGLLQQYSAKIILFVSDHYIASRSTATIYGIRVVTQQARGMWADGVVIGVSGRLATTLGRRLLQLAPGLDFAVLGEADETLGEVLHDIVCEGVDRALLPEHVVTARASRVSQPERGPTYAFCSRPDSLPMPAYHLVSDSLLVYQRIRLRPMLPAPFSLRTSLGCRFRCKFCAGVPHWNSYRTKSSGRVAHEIDALIAGAGSRGRLAFFEDEIFTADIDHVRTVAAVLRDRQIVVDGVYTHASMLQPAVAALLAGMTRMVYLGMDAADDAVLKAMGKGQTLDTILRAVDTAHAEHLKVHLEWIIGSPDETPDSITTSLVAIYNLLATGMVDSVNTYVYCPHPGTEYAESSASFGLHIVGGYEDIQESGGYPASQPARLNRDQVFVAYLMSQLVIREVMEARRSLGPTVGVGEANRHELMRLLRAVGGDRMV